MSSPDGYDLIARPGERRIIAGRHVWCVYEVPADDPAPPSRRCLIFESTKVVRRVREYPEHWRALTDEALGGLMEGL